MRNVFGVARLIRPFIVLLVVLMVSNVLYAQSTAIEPCPATPAPKPSASLATKVNERASETLIDSSVPDDPDIEKLLQPYRDKISALTVVIGKLDGTLTKSTIGAGTLGQFVTDAMLDGARKRTGQSTAMAITNAGGLRKNEIAAGQLRVSDIFELLPFENELITIDLTGAQLLKLAEVSVRNAQAGARIQFRWNEQNRTEVIGTKLLDVDGTEHEIDPNRTYTIVTIDYLYKLNSGSYAILREGKNLKELKVTIRDAVVDYVKSENAAGRPIRAQLDKRFVQIGPGPSQPVRPSND